MIRSILFTTFTVTVVWAANGIPEFLTHPALVLAALAVLIVCSAFFSGSEIALVSLSHARVRALAEKGVSGAQAIAKLKANPNRFLITILIGNNLVNITASVLATAWATGLFGSAALGWVTGVLTVIVLIAGEIFPKAFAQRHNELFARFAAPVLRVMEIVLWPVVIGLEWLLGALMSRMESYKTTHISALGELKAFIRLVGEKREIDANLQEILESAFEFDRTWVRTIMTPKELIVSVNNDEPVEKLRELFIQKGRSRIPVFENSHVVGLVNMHMLLEAQAAGVKTVGDMQPIAALRVEASAYIDDLLLQLQAANQQLALVYDQEELVGLVTVENILEEIVGEMHDEKRTRLPAGAFWGETLVAKQRA